MQIYWINRRNGNYRCLECGFQFHDEAPGRHARLNHQIAAHVEYIAKWPDGSDSRTGTIRVTAPSRKQVLSRALYRIRKRFPHHVGHSVTILED